MNLIQEELNKAKAKMLKRIPGTDLVELSSDNVAIVEAMIQNDSAYLKTSDTTAEPRLKKNGEVSYGGSTAYWMTKLKAVLIDGVVTSQDEFEEIVTGAVGAVDRENSTHLNSDGIGRSEIINRIIELDRAKLIDCLCHPDASQLYLIKYIAAATHPTGASSNGVPYSSRINTSFASKFCHYACFYLFEGTEYQDNYSIFDNVLKAAMPKYMHYYGIEKRNIEDYPVYRRTVDDIIDKSGNQISRNGFDHLLWYYFKGRLGNIE